MGGSRDLWEGSIVVVEWSCSTVYHCSSIITDKASLKGEAVGFYMK